MAGILDRIALKKLENENYDHQFGLYVSYDSPHKGASVPVGLQWMVHDVFFSLGPWPFIITGFVDLLELIFGIDIPFADIVSTMSSTAAQQMLSKHYLGNGHHVMMQNYLSQLGYPTECRKVAFTNGSNIATGFPETILGSEIISKTFIGGYYNVSFKSWYSGINTFQNVSRVAAVNLFQPWHSFYQVRQELFLNFPYEIAPGGSIGGVGVDFTFVPLVSAIDIIPNIYINNFYYYNKNQNPPYDKAYIISNNLTPFDDIYSRYYNSNHLSYIDILNLLEKQEIMYDRMYLQNRHIDKNRDFTAREFIVVGEDVQPNEFFNYDDTEHQKTIASGDFSIATGRMVNFRAGEYVDLDEEFVTNYADEFIVEIQEQTCPPQRLDLCKSLPAPQIDGNKYICVGEQYTIQNQNDGSTYEWLLKGNGKEIAASGNHFELNNVLPKGQYTLYCTEIKNECRVSASKVLSLDTEEKCYLKTAKKEEVKQKSQSLIVKIYPNPATDNIFISISGVEEQQTIITIYNISGRLVTPSKTYNGNAIQINLGNLNPGVYLVEMQVGDYKDVQRIIKNSTAP